MQNKMNWVKQVYEATTGMKAEVVCHCKNGINRFGLRCGDALVSPIIYIAEGEKVEDFIYRASKTVKESSLTFDLSVLSDSAYLLEQSHVRVQRVSQGDYISRPVLDLEAYIAVDIACSLDSGESSVKINRWILDNADITEKEIWNAAVRNTKNELEARSFEDMLGIKKLGKPLFEIITTSKCMYGAAALAIPEVFWDFCQDRGYKTLQIIPSSIHEVLVMEKGSLPAASDLDFAHMVMNVNDAEVSEDIQLNPVLYEYDIATNTIRIAADARC